MRAWRLTALLLAALAGCSEEVDLVVDVYSDFVAGHEVAEIRVTLEGGGEVTYAVAAEDDLARGVRVAELTGLAPDGARRLRVGLYDPSGALLLERAVIANNASSLALSVVLTRRCRGVICDEGLACLAGECVDPGCVSGREPSCPAPECAVDDDCAAMASCAPARCAEAVCVYPPDGDACASGVCDPSAGCQVPTPALRAPANGVYTGSALAPPPNNARHDTLTARLKWDDVPGADRYRVELTRECVPGAIASCAFASPELTLDAAGTTLITPRLVVDDTPPLGAMYAWRVAACAGADCGAPSAPRYLRVGRSRGDFNGDGYADLAVGGRPETSSGPIAEAVFVFSNDASGLDAAPVALTVGSTAAQYGETLAAGDFDGDGFGDLAVGAPAEDRVYVYLGAADGLDPATVQTLGGSPGLGAWLGATDLDGDGRDELLARADGLIAIYRGGPTGPSATAGEVAMAAPPRRMAIVGDVDGDGREDVVLSTEGSWTVLGGLGLGDAIVTSAAVDVPDDPYYGVAAGGIGDVDGDGLGDLAIGAGGDFNVGTGSPPVTGGVVVIGGGVETPYSIGVPPPVGRTPPERFGWTLRAAGDWDGDGFDDFLVGSVDGSGFGGAVYFLGGGPAIGAVRAAVFDLDSARFEAFAEDVTTLDLEADGDPDFIVGASSALADGALYVYVNDGTGAFAGPISVPHPPLAGGRGYFGASLAPRHR